jgi:hypothetical protein
MKISAEKRYALLLVVCRLLYVAVREFREATRAVFASSRTARPP